MKEFFISKLFSRRFWLLATVLLAIILRFWQLGDNPPSLTWDEAAWGYNAYSMGLTGKDEFGRKLPLDYLKSFGDYKPPLYAYLDVLPVKIFGLNEFTTRFPSAAFGVLTVWLTYFLTKELFNRGDQENSEEKVGLLAAFLLAISPWHIMLSRAAFEANVASFFIIAGIYFFLKGYKQTGQWLVLSALFFALSLYTFNTARVVAPLLVLGLVVGMRKNIKGVLRWLLTAAAIGLVVVLPLLSHLISPQARLRYQEVNIFTDSAVVLKANQEMANDNWHWWSVVIHNRRWGYFRSYLRHYFDHFKPSFLFIKGDGNPKFSTQDVGELYLWELPFLVIGILWLVKKRPGYWWLVFFWLLVGIIPAATARETPHALRIETTLPTWQIITAFGIVITFEWVRRTKVKKNLQLLIFILIFTVCILNFIYFQHGYWRHYPFEYSGEWQYGYREAVGYIKTRINDYDQVWLTDRLGRPYIYLLYYLQENPQEFVQTAKVNHDIYGFVQVKSFGKYHFFRSSEEIEPQGRTLVVDQPQYIDKKYVIQKTITRLNGGVVLTAHDYTIKPEYLKQIKNDKSN